MGFQDTSGIDLENEKDPIFPSTTAYFDKLYGPRHWSPPATTLNFSIGQGENTQTLINMMQFYEGLASDGRRRHAVHRAAGRRTSRARPGAHRRPSSTGCATRSSRWWSAAPRRRAGGATSPSRARPAPRRTPHGKDHGWFIGFAPADKPELVVGGDHGVRRARHDRGAVRRAGAPALHPRSGHRGHDQGQDPDRRDGTPQDTAPAPVELDPDSAAARAAGGLSVRARGRRADAMRTADASTGSSCW